MPETTPEIAPGLSRQRDIYVRGIQGQKPDLPLSSELLEQRAREAIPREAFDYLAGGAGSEDTMRANLSAFRRWRIVPRYLRNVAQRDLSVEVLGQRFRTPFMFAPIGVQSILHAEAEVAVARAAKSVGVPLVLSTLSSKTLEEVATALGDTPRWFQLYRPRRDEITASFLRRAEQSGYSAIVVTVDTYHLSWRERDLQNAYLPFVRGEGLANYVTDPVFKSILEAAKPQNPAEVYRQFGEVYSDPSHTWNDLATLRRFTRLPILLKGLLHPDDARKAVEHGMDGIIVSNHGGRQVDGAIGALDALPRIVDAVGNKTAILFDSGIRRGADIVKAIALGARCVLLGRPFGYGLAVNGEQGVRDVSLNLLADVDLTLALSGYSSFAELSRESLVEDSCRPAGDR